VSIMPGSFMCLSPGQQLQHVLKLNNNVSAIINCFTCIKLIRVHFRPGQNRKWTMPTANRRTSVEDISLYIRVYSVAVFVAHVSQGRCAIFVLHMNVWREFCIASMCDLDVPTRYGRVAASYTWQCLLSRAMSRFVFFFDVTHRR